MRLKSVIASPEKLVKPMNAPTSQTEFGVGQFFITKVLALPGQMPFSLHISYPKYVIRPVPM